MKSITHPETAALAVAALAVAIGGLVGLPSTAQAAIPTTAHVEGTLQSTGGGPVADGNYNVTFALYDAKGAAKAMWQEGPVAIAIKGGQWSYALGATKALVADAIGGAKELWLGIKVGDDPELPRAQMHSTFYAQAAGGVSCTGCLATSTIKAGPLDLSGFAVTAKEFIGDGSKLTGMKIPSGSCGTGLLAKGIDSSGKLICAKASPLPDDGISQVSQGLIQVVGAIYEQAKAVDVPDNNPAGISSSLTLPDSGNVDKLTFTVEINIKAGTNGIDNLQVCLVAPGGADHKLTDNPFCGGAKRYKLHDNSGGSGKKLTGTWPDPNKILTGDLVKDYYGKNPKGTWKLWVLDTKFDNNSKTIAEITKFSASARTKSNAKIAVQGEQVVDGNAHFKGDLKLDGSLTIGGGSGFPDAVSATIMFPSGSRPFLYGFKHDTWGNGNQYGMMHEYRYPYNIANTNQGLHDGFNRIVWGDVNGNFREQWDGETYGSNNDSRSQARIGHFVKNTTASAQTISVCYYHSGRDGNNCGGIAMNAANVYNRCDSFREQRCTNATFPANKTSFFVLKSAQSHMSDWNGDYWRLWMGYYNDTWGEAKMKPKGLEWDYLKFYKWLRNTYTP